MCYQLGPPQLSCADVRAGAAWDDRKTEREEIKGGPSRIKPPPASEICISMSVRLQGNYDEAQYSFQSGQASLGHGYVVVSDQGATPPVPVPVADWRPLCEGTDP